MATVSKAPTSDEAVSGTWTGTVGSRFDPVDDHPDSSGTNFITGGTAASAITFGYTASPGSAFSIPAGATISNVIIAYYDRKNAAQGTAVESRIKVGGNYYNWSSQSGGTTHNAANGTWTIRTETWATNPKTGVAWTLTDINGGGSNDLQAFGVNLSDANPAVDISSIQITVTYLNNYTLTMDQGGYNLTGQTLSFSKLSKLIAVKGDYAQNGQAVLLKAAKILPLVKGDYNQNGQSVGLNFGYRITNDQGSYNQNGQSVTLTYTPSTPYSFYRSITIDNTKVYDDLTDFPVLISGTYSYLKTVANGGKVEHASGYDIAFFSDSGLTTQLDHQVERWVDNTGEFSAWVKTDVTDSTDKVIYMAYGNSGISSPTENPTGVWDSDYKLVYHLEDGSTLDATDSTTNGNDGTISGAVAVAGQIDGGADFDGNDDGIIAGSLPTTNTTNISMGGWFRVSSFATEGVMLYNGDQGGDGYGFIIDPTTGLLRLLCGGVAVQNFNTSLTLNTWYHLYLTRDGSTWRMYVDGVQETNTYTDSPGTPSTYPFHIGDQQNRTANNAPMYVDEVRFSTVQRSAEWIQTEYYSQSDPSTFYTVGSEVGAGGYTMSMDYATYNQTGYAVLLKRGLILPITKGDYNQNGQSVGLIKSSKLSIDQGLYNLSGQNITFTTGYSLPIDQGAYSSTGEAVNLIKSSTITLTFGSYNQNGQSIDFRFGYTVGLSGGTYAQNGQSVALIKASVISFTQGSYLQNGQTINFVYGQSLPLSQGQYNLTGQSIIFTSGRSLVAVAGSYLQNGQSVTLRKGSKITLVKGQYNYTGQTLLFSKLNRIEHTQGLYNQTGYPVNFSYISSGNTGNFFLFFS